MGADRQGPNEDEKKRQGPHCDSWNDKAFLETALQALSAMPDFYISIGASDLYDCAPAYTGCLG